jgi:hypothetical protein
MKNTLKTMTTTIKTLFLLLTINIILSCSNDKNNPPKTEDTVQNAPTHAKSVESIIVNGIAMEIAYGKDGYTAQVQTDTEGVYTALVSIINVGGRENYKACEVGDKVSFRGTPEPGKKLIVKEIMSIEPTQTQMLITPISFRGIRIGDTIAKHGDYIKKTTLKTGEGTFQVYEIKDFENNPAGYFAPDPNNKLLVGDITVKTPKAQTVKGIKIGDTFQDLQKAFPNIEVHGSEIEGQTHATAHNLAYRLAVANFTYEIDKAKIPTTTKITEITIKRGGK